MSTSARSTPSSAPERIVVIYGGDSREAEVSKMTANGVANAIRASFPEVEMVAMDAKLIHALQRLEPDVIYPAVHGSPGEDGTLQGLLEMLGMAYVGSGVVASACGMDKLLAKRVFRAIGLTVPDDVAILDPSDTRRAAQEALDQLGHEVAVKPATQGSALGVTLVRGNEDVQGAIDRAFEFDDRVLIERFVHGREITASVLDLYGEKPASLPVIEIVTPKGTWYDYQHRYTPGLSEHIVPAQLPKSVLAEIERVACEAHAILGCRELSRADFIVDSDNRVYLLEVNTLPGMTPTSLYPDAASAAGLSFEELMRRLVTSAWQRAHAA